MKICGTLTLLYGTHFWYPLSNVICGNSLYLSDCVFNGFMFFSFFFNVSVTVNVKIVVKRFEAGVRVNCVMDIMILSH